MIQITVDVSNVDWAMLGKQKETLLAAIPIIKKNHPRLDSEDLRGLIHLIDSLQDQAAEIIGKEIVFGEEKPEERKSEP